MLPFFYTFYRFGRGIVQAFKDPEFEVLLALTAVVLVTGTIFYHGAEGWSYFDSLYFSVISLTTVGYGDMSPHTTAGKAFTMVYLFVGIGILFGFINTIAHYAVIEGKENGVILPKRFQLRRKREENNDDTDSTNEA